jgi:nitrogen fixation protein FixH
MNKGMTWPCAVVGLLGMNVAIVGVMVYQASTNTTMVPEPRYYERAVHFDEQVAQRAQNERLGWTAGAVLTAPGRGAPRLALRLTGRDGAPIAGALVRADVIPNARPASRGAITLAPEDDQYCGEVPSNQPGLWTVRLEARRGADVFTAELSVAMGAASAAEVRR